ncbi:MAG: hypothetical protein KJ687_08225 [Proteobacteria bacterium]|nr:hypothetical protein [Pseudomonadota bacterium]
MKLNIEQVKKRKEMMRHLRDNHFSYAKIGKCFGISRQRVHQILTDYKSDEFDGRDFLKEKIRKRDNWTCQTCGKIWQKGTRRFDVHHLDEELEGKIGLKYQNCKNPDRMITLCHKCHMSLESVRRKMSEGWKNVSTP